MIEQLIARGTVYAFLKQKKYFTLENVHKEILRRGGILRVSMGVTISEFLDDFVIRKIIRYSNKTGKYYLL